jgi:hypothetical protein
VRYEGPVWRRMPFPSLRFEGIRAGEGMEHRFSPHRLFWEFLLPLEPEGESVNREAHPALRRDRVGGPNRLQALFSEAGSTTRAGAPRNNRGRISGYLPTAAPGLCLPQTGYCGLSTYQIAGKATNCPEAPIIRDFAAMDWRERNLFPSFCEDLRLNIVGIYPIGSLRLIPDDDKR